jgi:Holliday junction resolvase RusA-like endonuclease
VWEDDDQVKEMHVYLLEPEKPGKCMIEIEEF